MRGEVSIEQTRHTASLLLLAGAALLVISVIFFALALDVPEDQTDLPQLALSEVALLGAGALALFADLRYWHIFSPGNRQLLLAAFAISNIAAGLFLILVGVGVLNLAIGGLLAWRALRIKT
jgi:hypothetical protein